jgi:hypothetical protein
MSRREFMSPVGDAAALGRSERCARADITRRVASVIDNSAFRIVARLDSRAPAQL